MVITSWEFQGADDIMLNYQSTSFHDALYVRSLLKLRPAPEFRRMARAHGNLGRRTSFADDARIASGVLRRALTW